jgi:hypothetical protein
VIKNAHGYQATIWTRLVLLNGATLTDVQTVQELSDILVLDQAGLLNVGRGLGYVLDAVTADLNLVFDTLRGLNVDALLHHHPAHDLLTQKVTVP